MFAALDLERIGALRHAAIVREAMQHPVLPPPHGALHAVANFLFRPNAHAEATLKKLDESYLALRGRGALCENLRELQVRYIRAHLDEFASSPRRWPDTQDFRNGGPRAEISQSG
jgi:hypothetical protein